MAELPAKSGARRLLISNLFVVALLALIYVIAHAATGPDVPSFVHTMGLVFVFVGILGFVVVGKEYKPQRKIAQGEGNDAS